MGTPSRAVTMPKKKASVAEAGQHPAKLQDKKKKKKKGFSNFWSDMKSQKWAHMGMVLDEVLIDDDRLNTIFGKYDINDNRVLTRDEFAAVVFDLNQIHAPDDALDAVIPLGGVTREKLSDILKRYKTYMNTRNKKIKAHRILVANFSAFDKNGSGALEEAEIM